MEKVIDKSGKMGVCNNILAQEVRPQMYQLHHYGWHLKRIRKQTQIFPLTLLVRETYVWFNYFDENNSLILAASWESFWQNGDYLL